MTAPASLGLSRPELLRSGGYIDGRWVRGDATLAVRNPADGTLVGEVANLGGPSAESAVAAASAAFRPWSARPAKERARILRLWSELMLANTEDLARILTAEQGKTLAHARGEVA